MVNRVELLGNLTHPPELRYSADGVPYCFLRLATNRYSNGKQFSDYHFVTAWRGQAESSAQSLTTGDRVFIEARIETGSVSREDGTRDDRIRLVATRVVFLHGRRIVPRVDEPTGPEHISGLIAADKKPSVEEHSGPAEESV
jgi:single-strand DNA-binding protein